MEMGSTNLFDAYNNYIDDLFANSMSDRQFLFQMFT